jgi:hypothetical protein
MIDDFLWERIKKVVGVNLLKRVKKRIVHFKYKFNSIWLRVLCLQSEAELLAEKGCVGHLIGQVNK